MNNIKVKETGILKGTEKTDLCQISLTGLRAIVLIGLLMERPRSLDEIKQAFVEYNIMDEDNSSDILRIDLNTLRAMGCQISRADKKTGNKYVLLKHPFELNITTDEVNLLRKAYRKLKNTSNIKTLIGYDRLFKKLAYYVGDNSVKEEILGLSVLKSLNTDLITELLEDCKLKMEIHLEYKSPVHEKILEMQVEAKDLVFKNDKVYVYAFDINKKEAVTLNVSRILKIIFRKSGEGNDNINPKIIEFKLKYFGVNGLLDCEKIISENSGGYLIRGEYHNDFVAMQRILSFGSDCTVVSPTDFRDEIIQKLKKIREIYDE
ncbi:WYL domain-containing protein [bacterium]|nr:WYL domain-containing protein [bacterium]